VSVTAVPAIADEGPEPRLLERVLAMMQRIEQRLARLEAANEPMRASDRGRPLSYREAAVRIGISRNAIPGLVRDRLLRTVSVNGRTRIPVAEVERVQREGLASWKPGSRRRTVRSQVTGSGPPMARDLV